MIQTNSFLKLILSAYAILLAGCASSDYSNAESLYTQKVAFETTPLLFSFSPELEERIMSLDSERVSERDIVEVLSQAPAPRIFNIHGGIYPVHLVMKNFSEFLIGMGYPEERIRHPKNGKYSFSCYGDSARLAGNIVWHYEREGLRPILIGHSQGSIQAIKVMHRIAGTFDDDVVVWNPITDESENRTTFADPLTGVQRPIEEMKFSYVAAIAGGGMGRILPNQWKMNNRLRDIPEVAVEFTGFYMKLDPMGGDFLGIRSAMRYSANDNMSIRNVGLPFGYEHVTVPNSNHLLKNQAVRDWINNDFIPSDQPRMTVEFDTSTRNILLAADMWHSIKRHWVLELQRVIATKQRRFVEEATASIGSAHTGN